MYTQRPYRDASDIARLKLSVGQRFASDPNDMPFGGLEWVVFGPHGYPPREIVQLWEDGRGDIAGWALLDGGDSFEYRVRSDLRISPLEGNIVEWGENGVLDWRAATGLDRRCAVACWDGDATRAALLLARGFAPSDAGGVLLSRSLETPIADPSLPDGWTVRGLREEDVDSRAQTQYEAFAPGSKTTPETWRYLMRSAPGYDRELDSIAVRHDGVVGAAALAWLDDSNQIGEFEPVGTRPPFQRRGLGRAVLLRGLAAMRERGMRTAIVGTNKTNAAAIAAYESAGFAICNRSTEYVLADAASRAP